MCDSPDHVNEHTHSEHCHDNDHIHSSVCYQCGKVHSVYFIKEHHCLEETLSTKKVSSMSSAFKNTSTRAPPLLIN